MKEYYQLKKTLHTNFKQMNIKINQFKYYYNQGTLLHGAVCNNFVGYAELLVKDGFDPNIQSRGDRRRTTVSLSQRLREGYLMKSLFKDAINDSEEKENENEYLECQDRQMNVRALLLRYNVCISCFSLILFCRFCVFLCVFLCSFCSFCPNKWHRVF